MRSGSGGDKFNLLWSAVTNQLSDHMMLKIVCKSEKEENIPMTITKSMNCTVGLVTVSGGGHGVVVCCDAGCGGFSDCGVGFLKKISFMA
ncbi:Hypothetical predicted protein [Octopus vulgaris]|uniref:Uncharacterized protein n=1 Tax=Octopus vulgaris TaxID=6645 RepID=A0AA36BRM1_OCTVU|nr:Hypothetical predicted protein [Octopus vulgaris]